MEEELRVLYVEGLATHDDPESCVDVPRGRGEALAGARVGRAIEPRNHLVRGADVVETAEGTIAAAYWAIRPQAAPGVDGVTWAECAPHGPYAYFTARPQGRGRAKYVPASLVAVVRGYLQRGRCRTRRVQCAGSCARGGTARSGSTVYGVAAPRRSGPAPGGLLGDPPTGRAGGGWGDVGRVRAGPGGQPAGPARTSAGGALPGQTE